MSIPIFYIKDADAKLDYGFDWSNWLASGETISSVIWTIPSGITKVSDEKTNSIAVVWLSGGVSGNNYRISCKITTSANRIDERTMIIQVKQR